METLVRRPVWLDGTADGSGEAVLGPLAAGVGARRAAPVAAALVPDTLVRIKPPVVAATADDFLAWLHEACSMHGVRPRDVIPCCRFLVATGGTRLLSRGRAAAIERYCAVRVLRVAPAGGRPAAASCECGGLHPLPGIDPRASFAEPHTSVHEAHCPFVGPTASIVPHGDGVRLLRTPEGPAGETDIEEELSVHGLAVRWSVEEGPWGWRVRWVPFGGTMLDGKAASRALSRRFGVNVTVEVA